ncbi:undecaprenyldiphospho-muramoylpentapeptide beta-N-acetylglucosaminyltransferase [Haliscomenobacter sp.]|uniref:undecaprenyldiphospho-muramoylpentapeptide beta-N-acetylglucosaminyltransferase n=1 Tax=Haliscomenobacter sp. TaxID=2717303 RepID=UPI0035935D6C
MNKNSAPRIIISGGGTGGHVFPAIAIADAIVAKVPGAQILFVGAQGKIEMEKVPKAGYPIEGLWISGFQRSLSLRNLLFPVKLLHSLLKARSIVRKFKPQAAVGVGGYASGPLLDIATRKGVPALIQEQNSYAGVTNKLLSQRVQKVCVAYEGMERFFPADKIVLTGNPVRRAVAQATDVGAARTHFGLEANKPTLLIFGGSLGALSINEAMAQNTAFWQNNPEIQVLWQSGGSHHEKYQNCATAQLSNVKLMAFIDRMDLAYAAADVVCSRAGALTISELCLVGKPAILVPSPFVAEDHQTKNAQALVDKNAAIMVRNADTVSALLPAALELLQNETKRNTLAQNILALAKPNAAEEIAEQVLKLVEGG